MFYTSTRDKSIKVTASQAIAQGISEEGGLFVPCELPRFSMEKSIQWFLCLILTEQKRFKGILNGFYRRRAQLLC